jgi:hypothetical protein
VREEWHLFFLRVRLLYQYGERLYCGVVCVWVFLISTLGLRFDCVICHRLYGECGGVVSGSV